MTNLQWRPSTVLDNSYTGDVRVEDARALVNDAKTRRRIEDTLRLLSDDDGPGAALVLFVHNPHGSLLGFIDVVRSHDGYVWCGPVDRDGHPL